MSHIFISYSHSDTDAATKLIVSIKKLGHSVWVDIDNLRPSLIWSEEIEKGIRGAFVFIYLLSPESIKPASYCMKEFEVAVKHSKKIVPILLSSASDSIIPKEISKYQWLKLDDLGTDFSLIDKLQEILETDFEWAELHAKLTLEAYEWEKKYERKKIIRLLSQKEIDKARSKFSAITPDRLPQPTNLIKDYIFTNERKHKQQKRTNYLFLIAFLILTTTAGFLWKRAEERQQAVLAKNLASQAQNLGGSDYEDLVVRTLLSVESLRRSPSPQAVTALHGLAIPLQISRTPSISTPYENLQVFDFIFTESDVPYVLTYKLESNLSDGVVNLWRMDTMDLLLERYESERVCCASLSTDGSKIAIGYESGNVLIVSSTGNEILTNVKLPGEVLHVKFSYNQSQVLVDLADNKDYLLEVNNGNLIELEQSENAYFHVYSPDNSLIAGVYNDNQIYFWDTATGIVQGKIVSESEGVGSLMFFPDGKDIALAGVRGVVEIWDISLGILKKTYSPIPDWYIGDIDISFDGTQLAIASTGGGAAVINIDDGAWEIIDHPSRCEDVQFSSDGRLLSSADRSGFIFITDLNTYKKYSVLQGASLPEIKFSNQSSKILVDDFSYASFWDISPMGVVVQEIYNTPLWSVDAEKSQIVIADSDSLYANTLGSAIDAMGISLETSPTLIDLLHKCAIIGT